MSREAWRFWIAAVAVAGAWAVASSVFFPYEALGLETGAERGRAWLLILWTSGVMAICFGAAGIISYAGPMGYKEVAEAGSLVQALEARRRAKRELGSLYTNFAWWLMATGAILVAIYFLVWGLAYA
jgi:hypothetical protein